VKRIGFILKPDKTEAGELLDQLLPGLLAGGHRPVFLEEDAIGRADAQIVPESRFAGEIDVAVVLGGDGTMLRASGLVADAGIPILGINLGHLGFLTPFDPGSAQDAIEGALSGSLATSERMRLSVTYRPAGAPAVTRTALNDTVIHQGAMARLIELEVKLDTDYVGTYRADGLIVSTPTGSTAYNLAAGGPIISHDHQAMVLTPICAHALTNRPLVVSNERTLRVRLGGDSLGVVLTVDGQWAHTFQPDDQVDITAGARPLVTFESDKGYFDILREKLHWGARHGDRKPRD
jgi:NAD+ kinase